MLAWELKIQRLNLGYTLEKSIMKDRWDNTQKWWNQGIFHFKLCEVLWYEIVSRSENSKGKGETILSNIMVLK